MYKSDIAKIKPCYQTEPDGFFFIIIIENKFYFCLSLCQNENKYKMPNMYLDSF